MPEDVLSEDLLHLKRQFNGVPLLFKFPAWTQYDWHMDRLRKCALNYEVQPAGQVLFGTARRKQVTEIEEVRYMGSVVLLDTTRWHTVINLTPKDRVTFSLGFNSFTYEDLKKALNRPS